MLGCWPVDTTAAVALELSPGRPGVEHITDLDAAVDEFFARSLNVGDDQVQGLGRARRGRGHFRAEFGRAPRAGRCELNDPKAVIEWEVGVEPPPEPREELLRAVNIGDRDDSHLELLVHPHRAGAAGRFTTANCAWSCHFSSYAFIYKCIDGSGLVCQKAFNGNKSV